MRRLASPTVWQLASISLGVWLIANLLLAPTDAAAQKTTREPTVETSTADAPADVDSTPQTSVERLRAAIDASRARIRGFQSEERGVFETIEEIDHRSDALKADVRLAQKRVNTARASVRNITQERSALEAKQLQTKRAMAKRVVALYKAGDVGPVRVLFSSHSLRDLLSVGRVVSAMLKMDRVLLLRFRAEQQRLDHIHEELAAAEEAARVAARVVNAKLAELETEKARKRQAIALLRSDRVRERGMLREFEASERALEETLQEAGAASGGAKKPGLWPFRKKVDPEMSEFKSHKGKLAPPVQAKVVSAFGKVVDTEFKTATVRRGIEYAAPLGSEVRAVANGAVRYAGWFRGYGKMIILDHGDNFFTVYGHLDDLRVKMGDTVMEGMALATVGETGSLEGPRLYFEIREGSTPRDPLDWLSE